MSIKPIFQSDINSFSALIQEFFETHTYFSEKDRIFITKAWDFLINNCKDELRSNGEPVYMHPLRVANILAENKLDADTIVASLLHSNKHCTIDSTDIEKNFGVDIANITATTNKILSLPINSKTLHQSDAIRKMLFAMCDDARIILITLADRLDRIRNINQMNSDYQKVLAEAAIDIWAPLADRLGMQKEKNEFEDLSLKYTNPEAFKQIKEIVAQKQTERSAYLDSAVNEISGQAKKMNMTVEIQSRAKHFYSIYQKMRKRNVPADKLFDLLALRILCDTNAQCYMLIGIVHSLWKPLDGRFKDYIAMPKANGYQSLHTTVMCKDKPLEIQIRTHKMHEMAEHGIASHWLYKKGTNKDLVEQDKLEIFNKLQALKDSLLTDGNNFKALKNELLGDMLYVFTPKGDVKKLPAGATAIDFAYSIHSAIGEKIIAAKADGKIIPLSAPLKNTQIIEVITNPRAHPTESQLAVVKTNKAHQKIHSWLVTNDVEYGNKFALEKEESLASSIVSSIPKEKKRRTKSKHGIGIVEEPLKMKNILVQGEKNVVYNLAQCCHPHYPQLIMGYVTRSKGVTVHRADCLVYQRIPYKENRSIDVSWDEN